METLPVIFGAVASLLGALIGAGVALVINFQNNRRAERRRFDQEITERIAAVLQSLRRIKEVQPFPDATPAQEEARAQVRFTQKDEIDQMLDELRLLCRSPELPLAVQRAQALYLQFKIGSGDDTGHLLMAYNAYDKVIKAAQGELSIKAEPGWTHWPEASIRSKDQVTKPPDRAAIDAKKTPDQSTP